MKDVSTPTFELNRAPLLAPAEVDHDRWQRAVVAHRDGPLLVLAGPGTGKTTTLVEAVAARVDEGARPEQVLVLTFSRKAAGELRDRITARLGRTTATPAAWTFHAFCYALLREHQDPLDYGTPLRLLSGPEQDVAVRELLRGDAEMGTVAWPPQLQVCLGTRGFAEEVRAVIARARQAGLEPADLAELGMRTGRADWPAVANFLAEYLDVLDSQGALDYAELVYRAGVLARRPAVQAQLRARYGIVFVDEYQDTDPAQEGLLQALAGDGGTLVVVGDPDQSIYGFRGADVTGLLQFRHRFCRRDGAAAPVLTLGRSRRAGGTLLAASRRLAGLMPLTGLPASAVRAHRDLRPMPGAPPGAVSVATYPSLRAEIEAVADLLRRAHLEDGVPWSRMAVLVRSGVRSIPVLRRALPAAGVPLEVAGDELPLAREAAAAPLMSALRCAADRSQLDTDRARTLLLSPLGGADASDLRRLGRKLRTEELAAGQPTGGAPRFARPSAELLREAVDTPEVLAAMPPDLARPAARLGRLIAVARAELAAGHGAEQALWALWIGSDWPRRLEAAAYAGGAAGRSADRDLDAVVTLFDTVARAQDRQPHRGVVPLLEELEAQQIPADTLAERPVRGEAVRLLTAHRAKGLEWDLVVVPGVQEGRWPDLRRRGTVLQPDRIALGDSVDLPTSRQLLAEERRLFYVAVTRARRRLVVTAVDSAEEDGERPSRFLHELGVSLTPVRGQARRLLCLPALVADLRAASVDPAASAGLRRGAATRLAMLAAATEPDGSPTVPAAHPDHWWGLLERTAPGTELHPAAEPLRLSGSAVNKVQECPLRWFLGSRVGAGGPASSAMGFGAVIHALADDLATGRCSSDIDAVMRRLDRVWGQLQFEAKWQPAQQRAEAYNAVQRLLGWCTSDRGRRLLDTEREFTVDLEVASGLVRLHGRMDRVELDRAGQVHVVDFKTGRTVPSGPSVITDPQLGCYQVAVRAGALGDLPAVGPDAIPGGAEIVQLRHGASGQPRVLAQPALTDADDGTPSWMSRLLDDVAARIRAEDFAPQPGDGCRNCDFRGCCPAQPEGQQVVQ